MSLFDNEEGTDLRVLSMRLYFQGKYRTLFS